VDVATDGTIYFMAVGLVAGDVVSNITVYVSTGGTATSTSLVGLYSKAGVRLAQSADQASAWNTIGKYTVAMTAPFTVTVSDGYFVAILAKTGTTMPTMFRGSPGAAGFNDVIGSGMGVAGTQTAQTPARPAAVLMRAARRRSISSSPNRTCGTTTPSRSM
jgi:hypothetical protein